MIDGNYDLSIPTPMGAINGKVALKSNGNQLMGTLECMGMKNNFNNGTVNGNQCNFSGALNTPLGNIEYHVTGMLQGSILHVDVQSNKGNIKLQCKKN